MPDYDSEADDILGEERMMDIAVLEAQVEADKLYEQWMSDFLGARKTAPKGKLNANSDRNAGQPVSGGSGQTSTY